MTSKSRSHGRFIFTLLGECLSGGEELPEEGRPFSTWIVLLLMALAGLLFVLYSITYGVLAHYV